MKTEYGRSGQQGHESPSQARPLHVELSRQIADKVAANFDQMVQPFLREGITSKDLAFRLTSLPGEPRRKQKRLDEIFRKGTDRTWHRDVGTFGDEHYKTVGREQGINPRDLIFITPRFREQVEYNPFGTEPRFVSTLEFWGSNAVLIYETATQYGLRHVLGEHGGAHAFNNPAEKHKALLGVISLKR